ncbi:MAG: multiubiquitin domain-containing protein, partial [Trebonia sp.]
MTEAATTPTDAEAARQPLVRVLVNGRQVTLHQAEATGEQVKAAAIAAGVPIQPDFVLSEVLPSGKQKLVPDDKKIHLKESDEFWAIPGDDNS